MLPHKKNNDVESVSKGIIGRHFSRLRDGFARAGAKGINEQLYRIAGYRVAVRLVGGELTDQVTRALAHLETAAAGEPALTIEIWDERESGVGSPARVEPLPDKVHVLLAASDDGRFVQECRPQGTAILDRTAHRIVACVQDARARYLDERARPFHRLLSTWLNDRGIQFVHAGLVTMADRGILLGGHGGAGKSTSSIASLCAGHGYLGDDFIGLEERGGDYLGYGLFASCLLELHHMQRFPELAEHALMPFHAQQEDKAVFYLNDLYPDTMLSEVRIDAIALPTIGDGETTFEPVSKSETLLAMAPTSVMLLPAPTSRAFHVVAGLVAAVPTYRLRLGPDIDRIPDALARLAAGLDG